MAEEQYGDLFSLIADELAEHPEYCQSSGYWIWERDVADPALRALGYKINRWWDGERDSFGPLSRLVSLTKDGITKTYIYG